MSDAIESFDLENPVLPKAIRKAALASGGYPYAEELDQDVYEAQLQALQIQLVALQSHLQNSGERMVLVFEGRDAAGKGGTIKTYTENLNPRVNIDVALPKPSDRERTQWYFQRYVEWLPAAGEVVLFDRSWYNRAGVEPVMGYCTREQTAEFLRAAPNFERMLVEDGIHLFKFWLSIGREMQLKRFHDRRHDPLKLWKISPVDLAALDRWDDYGAAARAMLEATHIPDAPWRVVLANDKRRARLNVMRSVLTALDFTGKDEAAIGRLDSQIAMAPPEFLATQGAG